MSILVIKSGTTSISGGTVKGDFTYFSATTRALGGTIDTGFWSGVDPTCDGYTIYKIGGQHGWAAMVATGREQLNYYLKLFGGTGTTTDENVTWATNANNIFLHSGSTGPCPTLTPTATPTSTLIPGLGCSAGTISDTYSGNNEYTYPNQPISSSVDSYINFSWGSVDRPNRFSVYDSTGLLWTSGWVGFADYAGPWGASLNTPSTGNSNICFLSSSGRYVQVQAGNASPTTPISDAYNYIITCIGSCPGGATPTPTTTPTGTPASVTPTPTPTCPIPTLYLASTNSDACNQINGQLLTNISYTTTGTCSYCNYSTLNSTEIPGLTSGTYYVSDGTSVRAWTKSTTPSVLFNPTICSSCSSVTPTPTSTPTGTPAPVTPTPTPTPTGGKSLMIYARDVATSRATITMFYKVNSGSNINIPGATGTQIPADCTFIYTITGLANGDVVTVGTSINCVMTGADGVIVTCPSSISSNITYVYAIDAPSVQRINLTVDTSNIP